MRRDLPTAWDRSLGVSTRKVDDLVRALGQRVRYLQIPHRLGICKDIDKAVGEFCPAHRSTPAILPHVFVWDATFGVDVRGQPGGSSGPGR